MSAIGSVLEAVLAVIGGAAVLFAVAVACWVARVVRAARSTAAGRRARADAAVDAALEAILRGGR